MTITYFASAGVLYAQEGGRCAKRVSVRALDGFTERWVAVPVPDMAALFPTREAVPVADDVRYGTWTDGRHLWRCHCHDWPDNMDIVDRCLSCGTHRPA